MNDDWRVQITFDEETKLASVVVQHLEAHQLQHDLSQAFHDRVIVTEDGPLVFLYAGAREQAEKACKLVKTEAQRQGWAVSIELRRWHPISERWEDPDKALPTDGADWRAEREDLMRREREESIRRGYPEFEVRVDLPSHHDAVKLVETLHAEGLLPVHRWRYVLVGAADEDNARALAKRIEDQLPAGGRVSVEGTWAAVLGERPASPFSIFRAHDSVPNQQS